MTLSEEGLADPLLVRRFGLGRREPKVRHADAIWGFCVLHKDVAWLQITWPEQQIGHCPQYRPLQ